MIAANALPYPTTEAEYERNYKLQRDAATARYEAAMAAVHGPDWKAKQDTQFASFGRAYASNKNGKVRSPKRSS
jgi:hypothetical protein